MYFMYISPILADISVEKAKKAEYANVLLRTKELKEKRDILNDSYNSISPDNLALLDKVMPSKFESTVFANDITGIAYRNGLLVNDLRTDALRTQERNSEVEPGAVDVYRTVKTSMRVTGSYENFIRFLRDVEKSLQLIDVSNLSITTVSGTRPTEIIFNYSLEINTYSLQ